MILSVIIVNYRVRYFLELCLHSVEKALRGLQAEVLVVDNGSGDGSVEYLRPRFPGVQFIANRENTGFARANNQAFGMARGRYVLFLNPDTIVPENFATVCLAFLESHPTTGGLGVRMVDGSGRFLKESSRGFPTPWVSFCKMMGLTALFPHSRWLAGYYLGHLSPEAGHPAPVLSGACFWVGRSILEELGGFDERFFMYAEDIDLSYRIGQAGYTNYYLAETTILHFKGESTRKDIRYVKLFYTAMSQFRRKHFRGPLQGLFGILLDVAIWMRAGIAAAGRTVMGSMDTDSAAASRVGGPATGEGVIRAHLMGDPGEVEELSSRLVSSGKRVMAGDLREADEIIYCEGPGFSFADAIAELEADAKGGAGRGVEKRGKAHGPLRREHKFHALGSGSVTGSESKDGRGETILL